MTEPRTAPFEPSIATARMADGTNLRTVHWPEPDDPWATALIVHGLGEHAGRYANVAAPLVGGRARRPRVRPARLRRLRRDGAPTWSDGATSTTTSRRD